MQANNLAEDRISNCQLWIDNRNGLIFSSAATQIKGTAKLPPDNHASYSILILDETSDKIARIGLKSMSKNRLERSFIWDLKSGAKSYVRSGRYTIRLVEQSDGREIERCSMECTVADTREIISTTDLLKSSESFANRAAKRIISIYAEIMKDIELRIIEGLEHNKFDEPYFVARTTAGFTQQIYNDIKNDSTSEFHRLIEEFALRNSGLAASKNGGLGLLGLFDFLVNYMADAEDQARATAMIKCGYRNFTENDRKVILSALVSGIFPHCVTFRATNAIGREMFALVERLLKIGIRYICARHIDKSISICKTNLNILDC